MCWNRAPKMTATRIDSSRAGMAGIFMTQTTTISTMGRSSRGLRLKAWARVFWNSVATVAS